MNAVSILGIGTCAMGLPDWSAARDVLRGERIWQAEELPKLDIRELPVAERRRVSAAARLAITAATQAVAPYPPEVRASIPSVFATGNGDGQILASTLQMLRDDPGAMSPTLFHNSVFNAAAGYWTIAGQSRARSTTVSAGIGTFAAGVLEAGVQVHHTSAPVLLVAVDLPFPPALASFEVRGAPFACALLLGPASAAARAPCGTMRISTLDVERPAAREVLDSAMSDAFRGNPAAQALALLAAVARSHAATLALPYVDTCNVEIGYVP